MPRPNNYNRDEIVRIITNALIDAGYHANPSQLGSGSALVRLQYKGAHIDIRPTHKKEVDESWRKEYNQGLRQARLALRANYTKDYDLLYKLYKDDGLLASRASMRAYTQLAKRYPTEWVRLRDKYTKGAKNGR